MSLQGLKINISVHLVVLIALGMIMVNLAMTTAFQKLFVNREIANGDLLISTIQAQLDRNFPPGDLNPDDIISIIEEILTHTDYTCLLVLDEAFKCIYEDTSLKEITRNLELPVRKAMREGKKAVNLSGETWGVFWKADEFLLFSFPLKYEDMAIAGVGLAYNLSGFYLALRQIQLLLWLFMAVATVLLAFAGFYQLSKIAVNPIYRLLRRVEAFETEDHFLYPQDDKSDEFRRLSFSLNQMLMRISQDKRMLQSTIESLGKSNNELKQAQKEIINSEKLASVGRLSAGIAHEIGNPISIILGYIALLKKENIKPNDRAEYVLRAEKEILRVKNIVRQLLDYTRPANEGIKTVSSHGLINDLIKMVTPQPLMKNIRVALDLKAQRDLVLGNPDLLLQVFLNLFVNAADAVASSANNPDAKITISTENTTESEDIIQIKFSDNGIGISEQYREALFDPFFTTKEPGKGTGLGLYISFMIIENMGGKIEVSSDPEKNTTISVALKTVLSEVTNES